MSDTSGAAARHRVREAALQMLYQWEVGRTDLDEAIASYPTVRPYALTGEGETAAETLVRGTANRLDEIDTLIRARSEHWRLERMSVIDRLILRLAAFELLASPATPRAVVITEALELARTFSTEAAVKFINGVLDAIARDLASARPDDTA